MNTLPQQNTSTQAASITTPNLMTKYVFEKHQTVM